jgi:hypothetical protein
MQDTGKFRTNSKDQFYTKSLVAKTCVDTLLQFISQPEEYLWLEPSAGNGSFLKAVPSFCNTMGLDIDPPTPEISQTDFLTWDPIPKQKYILFGNPPFGRQASLAKAFISKGCEFATFIAFILPRSFMKPSMTNVFPLPFHCIYTRELEKNSFEINQQDYHVPCVFQIWEKKTIDRVVAPKIQEEGFVYVKWDDSFHLAFRRVGGLAGQCYEYGLKEFNPQCFYFLQFENKFVKKIKKIIKEINSHSFPSNTVGPKSLSKSEINQVVNEILKKL